MAKKVVASLQDKAAKKYTRCIKMIKEGSNDSYVFKDEMVANERVKNFFD